MDCQWLIISVNGRFLPLIHSDLALKWHWVLKKYQ